MLFVANQISLAIVILIAGVMVQMMGSLFISLAFLIMIALNLFILFVARDLKTPLSKEGVINSVKLIEASSIWFIFAALLMAVFGAKDWIEASQVSLIGLLTFGVKALATYCLLTVAFYDIISQTKVAPKEESEKMGVMREMVVDLLGSWKVKLIGLCFVVGVVLIFYFTVKENKGGSRSGFGVLDATELRIEA